MHRGGFQETEPCSHHTQQKTCCPIAYSRLGWGLPGLWSACWLYLPLFKIVDPLTKRPAHQGPGSPSPSPGLSPRQPASPAPVDRKLRSQLGHGIMLLILLCSSLPWLILVKRDYKLVDYNIKIRLYDFYLYMRSKKLNKQIKKKKADSYYREQYNCCQR